jgi:hypothetical protein
VASTKLVKVALKREDDGTPVGIPGNMYLDCPCGHHLSLPRMNGLPIVGYVCVCGREYDKDGWILKE